MSVLQAKCRLLFAINQHNILHVLKFEQSLPSDVQTVDIFYSLVKARWYTYWNTAITVRECFLKVFHLFVTLPARSICYKRMITRATNFLT